MIRQTRPDPLASRVHLTKLGDLTGLTDLTDLAQLVLLQVLKGRDW